MIGRVISSSLSPLAREALQTFAGALSNAAAEQRRSRSFMPVKDERESARAGREATEPASWLSRVSPLQGRGFYTLAKEPPTKAAKEYWKERVSEAEKMEKETGKLPLMSQETRDIFQPAVEAYLLGKTDKLPFNSEALSIMRKQDLYNMTRIAVESVGDMPNDTHARFLCLRQEWLNARNGRNDRNRKNGRCGANIIFPCDTQGG